MKKGTKEFYDMQLQFEKQIVDVIYGHTLERVGKDEKVPVGIFYDDGLVNQMFQIFMRGYQVGRNVYL